MPKQKKKFTEAEKHAIKWLVSMDGKTLKEVAAIMGIKESTFLNMVNYNNFAEELKESRESRLAKLKENIYRLSFPRETEEREYEMVPCEKGQSKFRPKLKKIKKKYIDPNQTALIISTVNMLRWKTTSGDLNVDAVTSIKGFSIEEAEKSFDALKKEKK